MKSKITFILFSSLFFLTMSSFFTTAEFVSPCDAPAIQGGLTAAPGEGSCGQSGCHTGNVNTGSATNFLDINEGLNEYIPGETYPVTISMSQQNISKFGFQITALKDSDNSFIGTFSLTDPANTRLINALGRKYVGTTACGSDSPVPDSIQWDFEWTAPSMDEGNVTFYLITIATNHNHSGSGDFVYTQSLQLAPLVNAVGEVSILEKSLNVFPNPARDLIQIEYDLEQKEEVILSLFGMDGKEIFKTAAENQTTGTYQKIINLQALGLASGVYMIKITTKETQVIRRISFINSN